MADVFPFYQCYTSEEFNVTGPSLSPENDFIVPDDFTDAGSKVAANIAPTMDGELNLVFNNVIEAGEILGIDDDVVSAYITSRNGGDSQLRYVNGPSIAANVDVYQGSISTSVDATYYVTFGESEAFAK